MNKYQLQREHARERRMLNEFAFFSLSGLLIVPTAITLAAAIALNADRIDSFFTWVASEIVKFFVL
jgi:succinate dehydrogenase hydrophobic anchor subunit